MPADGRGRVGGASRATAGAGDNARAAVGELPVLEAEAGEGTVARGNTHDNEKPRAGGARGSG